MNIDPPEKPLKDRVQEAHRLEQEARGLHHLAGAMRIRADEIEKTGHVTAIGKLDQLLKRAGIAARKRQEYADSGLVALIDRDGERFVRNEDERQAANRTLQKQFSDFLLTPIKMRKPSASIAHKAMTALEIAPTERVYLGTTPVEQRDVAPTQMHSLTIEHDWAAVIGDQEKGAEWKLPYSEQCFEFDICGWHTLAFAAQNEEGKTLKLVWRVPGMKGGWVADEADLELLDDGWRVLYLPPGAKMLPGLDTMISFVHAQIRAICIMLDAQVAEVQPTRAPYKTNLPPKERSEEVV